MNQINGEMYGARVYRWMQNRSRPTVAIRRTVKVGHKHRLLREDEPMHYGVNIDATDHAAIGRAVVEAIYPEGC